MEGITEILGKIGFDWQVALANLVNFIIIFLILKYLAFKPIQNVIEKRRQAIKEGLDNADEARTALREAESRKEAIIMEARQEANGLIATAKEQADRVVEKTLRDAESEKVKIITEGQKKAEREFDRMQQEVRGQAAELVVLGVEKILQEDLGEKDYKKLSDKAVAMMRK